MFYTGELEVENFRNFFCNFLNDHNLITNSVENAEFIVLPFLYEIIYDYNSEQLKKYDISEDLLNEFRKIFIVLDELSLKTNKKLIVFFYRDPHVEIKLLNGIIFRTSTRKSFNRKNEFGCPAFINNKSLIEGPSFLPKIKKPRVTFRGQAAPEKLPLSVFIKRKINQYSNNIGLNFQLEIKNYYPEGYLCRRDAAIALKNNNSVVFDLQINSWNDSKNTSYIDDYKNSFLENDYVICASGYGNYSFRLYETMYSGLIPVIINTDCVLPCEEQIDWKKYCIWIEAKDAHKADKIILDFHQNISEADFLDLKRSIKNLYESKLTTKGFSEYLVNNLLPTLV